MATTKVAISLDSELLQQLDRLVAERVFPNRSQAVQDAIRDKLVRLAQPLASLANARSLMWERNAILPMKASDEMQRNGRNTKGRRCVG